MDLGDLGRSVGGMVDNTLGTNMFGQNANVLASETQAHATDQANKALTDAYTQQQGYLQPYQQVGGAALGSLANNDFMNNWQQDPGYQFTLQQGNNAINASAAARGMGNSGATMKALTQYGQDLASSQYNTVYNRESNRLSQLAGYGANASTNLSSAAGAYGAKISNNYTGLGDAQGASQIAMGNQQAGVAGQLYQNLGTGTGMASGKGGAAFSDERLKTNIEPVSKEDLTEMKKFLKAFHFNYISDEFGKGDWVGIMAQDLEKSKLGKILVVENEQGLKQIDIAKVMSLFLATMAEG